MRPALSSVKWTHSALIQDLMGSLFSNGYITSEVKYGPSWTWNSRIPDVIKIRKSYTRIDVQIFEVKVHRSDFLGEIRNGKYQEYLPRCTRFSFATPAEGVVNSIEEIPENCGWMTRGPTGWKVRQTPKIRHVEPKYGEVLALLMAEHDRANGLWRTLQHERKMKHRHNVTANAAMKIKLNRWENDVRARAEARSKTIQVLSSLRTLTGLTLDRWSFESDLRNWVERHKTGGGVSPWDLGAMRSSAKEILSRIESIERDTKSSTTQETDATT